jgi:hypothetical protein
MAMQFMSIAIQNIASEFLPQWGPLVRKLRIQKIIPEWWVSRHEEYAVRQSRLARRGVALAGRNANRDYSWQAARSSRAVSGARINRRMMWEHGALARFRYSGFVQVRFWDGESVTSLSAFD